MVVFFSLASLTALPCLKKVVFRRFQAEIALPINRRIDELLELWPDWITSRWDHLRRLDCDQLLLWIDPEERICEAAPAKGTN